MAFIPVAPTPTPIRTLPFQGFSCPRSTVGWKHGTENSGNKPFISFKLHPFWVVWWHLKWPTLSRLGCKASVCLCCRHSLPNSHIVAVLVVRSAVGTSRYWCSSHSFFYLIRAPRCKSTVAGHSDMPKGSHKVYVRLGENVVYVGFSTIYGFTGGLRT